VNWFGKIRRRIFWETSEITDFSIFLRNLKCHENLKFKKSDSKETDKMSHEIRKSGKP